MDNNQSPVEEKKVPNWIVRLPDDSDMDYLGRIVTYMAEESPDMHQIMESWQIVAGRDWKRTKIGRETIQGQRPILSLSATNVPPKPLCDEATIKAWFQIVGRVDYFLATKIVSGVIDGKICQPVRSIMMDISRAVLMWVAEKNVAGFGPFIYYTFKRNGSHA